MRGVGKWCESGLRHRACDSVHATRRRGHRHSRGAEQGLGAGSSRQDRASGATPRSPGPPEMPSFYRRGFSSIFICCLPSAVALCTEHNPPETEGRPRHPQASQVSSGCNGEQSGSSHCFARGRWVSPLPSSLAFSTLKPLLMR